MFIPDEMLPTITVHPLKVKHPKLPNQAEIHGHNRGKNSADATSADHAMFHYKEALSHLALSKWYLEQEAGNGEDH